MFSLISSLPAALRVTPTPEVLRASSSESVLSTLTVDASLNAPSSSATPPTSIGDSASITSIKLDSREQLPATVPEGRSKRVRTSVGTYNVKVLAGTAIHAPKKYSKDPDVIEARRLKLLGKVLQGLQGANESADSIEKDTNIPVSDETEVVDTQHVPVKRKPNTKSIPKSTPKSKPAKRLSLGGSPKKTAKQKDIERRKSLQPVPKSKLALDSISKRMKTSNTLGKRAFEAFEEELAGLEKAKRELKNLADTPEFAKIELKPVIHEVWSKGKLVPSEPPTKKRKVEAAPSPKGKGKAMEVQNPSVPLELEEPQPLIKKSKVYLTKGLYAGQEPHTLDWFKFGPGNSKKQTEVIYPSKPNKFMPLPMWHGQRLLQVGRHFQLPFDVCAPLPPGQPKPDEWRKTSSNRFVGEAKELWKRSKWNDSSDSKCICTPETGCDEHCQNRVMLYECNETNCVAGQGRCTNRPFADLAERRKLGGKFRVGVDVVKTADRGYGVRSNRCFDANQIIVEYTGEIITESECDRRMNEDYKNNDCYYLMSFDQGMILDGTKGSIARFINHSCKPNCKMVKWVVGGKPRMALFAGDNPIMSGDELTYDYNFDPFSAKNVQECRCGNDNCRGVLGPKPKPKKEPKPTKGSIKKVLEAGAKAVKVVKRKIKEVFAGPFSEDENEDAPSPKKRKVKEATGAKRSISSSKLQPAKKATTIRKINPSKAVKARRLAGTKKGAIIVKKTVKKKTVKSVKSTKTVKPSGKAKKNTFSSKSSTKMAIDDIYSIIDSNFDTDPVPAANISSFTSTIIRKNAERVMRGIRKGSREPSQSDDELTSLNDEWEDEPERNDDDEEYEAEDEDES